MAILADILLFAAALAAAIYCHVLARRLRRLADMRKGLGGTIATLNERVDEMRRALDAATGLADRENAERRALIARGEKLARRLEIMLAVLQDLDDGALSEAARRIDDRAATPPATAHAATPSATPRPNDAGPVAPRPGAPDGMSVRKQAAPAPTHTAPAANPASPQTPPPPPGPAAETPIRQGVATTPRHAAPGSPPPLRTRQPVVADGAHAPSASAPNHSPAPSAGLSSGPSFERPPLPETVRDTIRNTPAPGLRKRPASGERDPRPFPKLLLRRRGTGSAGPPSAPVKPRVTTEPAQ